MRQMIGNRVQELRESKGWSQAHLARVAGLSTRTVVRVENAETDAAPETRQALAQAFDKSVEELLYPSLRDRSKSKPRKYILEVYFQGQCIEQRRSEYPYIAPDVGDEVYFEFQNPSYAEEHGRWWRVMKKRHLKFAAHLELETLMLFCEPCEADMAW